MESRNNILSELQSISPIVAEIVPVNPYQVPTGYFEDFTTQMLLLVKPEETSRVLLQATQTPYKVPDHYFENLPEQILLLLKKEEVSIVLKDADKIPYQVPQGYFEGLADTILRRVKASESISVEEELESLSPLLSRLDKKNLFSTPSGYFDDLTGNVVAGMKAIDFVNEELENLSPLMNSLKTGNVYNVPADYFEGLSSSILNKIREQKPAKIVTVSFGKKMMRYAAAAVIAGIIVTTGILFVNNRTSSISPGTIAQSEEKLQQEALNNVKGASDDELFTFIEDENAPLPDLLSMATSSDINSDDVKLMLADIPDSELKQYLVEYSDAKEILSN